MLRGASVIALAAGLAAILAAGLLAASAPAQTADAPPADPPPIESALPGDRASGWFRQTRSELLARRGVVATSQPLAAEAGLQILRQGGNAIDAAIAAAAVLNVVEPGSAGIGGDVFAIVWLAKERKLIALNASGRAPAAATLEAYRALGYDEMPLHGVHSITAPAAVDGWDALLSRAGTMSFDELLEPASRIAREGFAMTERIRQDWVYGARVIAEVGDPETERVYMPGGEMPPTYSIFSNPELADALDLIREGGRDAFYKGPIAEAMIARVEELGGLLTHEDLDGPHHTWVEPISTSYRGYDVYEMPPSTQGFAALEMLNIIEVCAPALGLDIAALGPRSPDYWHFMVEAKKLAFADLHRFNGDPDFSEVPVDRLISKDYAATLCERIDMAAAAPASRFDDAIGGTVYIATADAEGNMVSFIYSIYDTFGSGVTVPGFGFVLADRGALFDLDPESPNVIAPGKRPFHTLLPGFLMKDGAPVMAFGLMGGSQQAQGHAQVIVDMLDFGANVQAASDAARFNHYQGPDVLTLETLLYDDVGAELAARGHDVRPADGEDMGGYQAIRYMPIEPGDLPAPVAPGGPLNGVYAAGSDHRKDGGAQGY
jgi:gamma-glutamyltranspeptidase/glutathione hydrolase